MTVISLLSLLRTWRACWWSFWWAWKVAFAMQTYECAARNCYLNRTRPLNPSQGRRCNLEKTAVDHFFPPARYIDEYLSFHHKRLIQFEFDCKAPSSVTSMRAWTCIYSTVTETCVASHYSTQRADDLLIKQTHLFRWDIWRSPGACFSRKITPLFSFSNPHVVNK